MPEDSSVTWDMEILLPFTELVGSPRPGGVPAPTGPLMGSLLIDLGHHPFRFRCVSVHCTTLDARDYIARA